MSYIQGVFFNLAPVLPLTVHLLKTPRNTEPLKDNKMSTIHSPPQA